MERPQYVRISIRWALALAVWSTLFVTRAPAQPPADLALVSVVGGTSSPVAIRHAGDGSGRLFIVQQDGLIRIFNGTSILATPFLDLVSEVTSGGERGLLGLAFHPNYASNGYFYVNYTRTGVEGLETVVERYTVSAGDANVANAMSGTEILVVGQTFANHNGGDIHFGPDGYLYIGMGDGGGWETSQDLSDLLGKMLRIDVDGGTPYAIPPDNPYVGNASIPDEIWASGLRNPWRWSFDRWNGDMLIGDVGEGAWEEVSFEDASSAGGLNYGWLCREGAHDFLTKFCTGKETLTEPVMEHDRSNGACSVIGGFVYRGLEIPALRGYYFFNDWCSGESWFATETAPGVWTKTAWDDVPTFNVVGYGESEDGEIYVASGEEILTFSSASSVPMVFADGFELGNTTGWALVVP